MHTVYIDDSKDDDSQSVKLCVFAALLIHEEHWLEAFSQIREYRRSLRGRYGIFVSKELHASEFVGGRGRISDRIVTKWERSEIFKETLQVMANLVGAQLIMACDKKEYEFRLFERLLNRINVAMNKQNNRAILICDEGNNVEFTRLVRRMSVYNPIPSQFGAWETGDNWKNITLDNILEDPIFKDSKQSFFLQLVDFAAFALLRQENQLASRNKYGLHEAFNELEPILIKEAFHNDSRGIIRAT